jgi:hypothetical protein
LYLYILPIFTVTYDNPKTLKVLKALSEYMDFAISSTVAGKEQIPTIAGKDEIVAAPTKRNFQMLCVKL